MIHLEKILVGDRDAESCRGMELDLPQSVADSPKLGPDSPLTLQEINTRVLDGIGLSDGIHVSLPWSICPLGIL